MLKPRSSGVMLKHNLRCWPLRSPPTVFIDKFSTLPESVSALEARRKSVETRHHSRGYVRGTNFPGGRFSRPLAFSGTMISVTFTS